MLPENEKVLKTSLGDDNVQMLKTNRKIRLSFSVYQKHVAAE
jgi:hypothetical protein